MPLSHLAAIKKEVHGNLNLHIQYRSSGEPSKAQRRKKTARCPAPASLLASCSFCLLPASDHTRLPSFVGVCYCRPSCRINSRGATQASHLKSRALALKANVHYLVFPLSQGKTSSALPLSGLDSPSRGSRGKLTSKPPCHNPPSLSRERF